MDGTQALDGKIVEAEDQAGEADEKALACKSDWENKDLDWKGRNKEWSQKNKKETRSLSSLEEARGVLQVLVCVSGSLSLSPPPLSVLMLWVGLEACKRLL